MAEENEATMGREVLDVSLETKAAKVRGVKVVDRSRQDKVLKVEKAAEDKKLAGDMVAKDREVDMVMIKTVLEGAEILSSPPHSEGIPRAPIVTLQDGLILDDRMFEAPTLLLGAVGSGKSYLLNQIMDPILRYAEANEENSVIFCAKPEFLKYRRPQDPVISVDATEANSCWNLFQELCASHNADLTARDIVRALTQTQRSQLQPFFVNAANDILFQTIMCMHEEAQEKHTTYTNWHLVDFLNKTGIESGEMTWSELAHLRPNRFAHIKDYLGNNLGQGYGVISEIRTLIHDCFWGSFCSDCGNFSAIQTLKSGGKRIFLYYDYANSSEASIKILRTILNLLLKHSIDQQNRRRTWFFLDEASLLPETCIADAMSLGREQGFRLFMCLQSAQLMTRHYKEEEAKTLLSLFPNVICMKVQDAFSRRVVAERYGKNLCSYSFSAPMQKVIQHVSDRPVVADFDFSQIGKKGDAICSIPNLSMVPFFYHGYRKELETNEQ